MLADEPYLGPSAEDEVQGADQALFNEDEGYQSQNPSRPSQFEDSGYDSPNSENWRANDEYRARRNEQNRRSLIDQAKRNIKRGAASVRSDVKKAGLLEKDTPENREKAKKLAEQKARKLVKDKVAKKIGDKATRVGFEKGLSKSAGKAAKEGAKRLTKAATKAGVETGTKALQGEIAVAGAGAGLATFGFGFLVSLLINIAISLGINDTVEGFFELKGGNIKKARYYFERAGTKIGMFIVLLVALVLTFSIAGLILGIPILIGLNIYMLLGIAYKDRVAFFEGFVWWEKAIIILLDLMALIFVLTFLLAIGTYLCSNTGLNTTAGGAAASLYDWWKSTNTGSVAADLCKYAPKL